MARSEASAWPDPSMIDPNASWLDAQVPGTVAAALSAAGLWDAEQPAPLETHDFWYRTTISCHGRNLLHFAGLATIAEIYLDDALVLRSDNMFHAHEVAVSLDGEHRLHICFRALEPVFNEKRKRARWRPRLASPAGLRFVRTTLLGHMPGWCPPIHGIGPWRAIEQILPGPLQVRAIDLRSQLEGTRGILDVEFEISPQMTGQAWIECAGLRAALAPRSGERYGGRLEIENVAPWWPHTHGEPNLHRVTAVIGDKRVDLGRVGFRRIEVDRDSDGKGFGIKVNGVPVFCRGACWTNADLVGLSAQREIYTPRLSLMRQANMNMVRVGGTMLYEGDDFYELCDEMGLMVWQDFMCANFDYPADDPSFLASIETEARQFLSRTQTSPSITVLCGGSEIAQQASMFGLPKATWSNAIFDELLPKVATELRPDVPFVPHTPFGGDLPFVPQEGLSHYYGVSAHQRPLEDARLANVRFAVECLGFANVPDIAPIRLEPARAAIDQPLFGERIRHDMGAIWFFEEVRNHYLEYLYGVDARELRRNNAALYLDYSRATSAEIMEAVFGDWRRAGSPTRGGLVWFLQDVGPGAGWGLLDRLCEPKAAYYALKRAFRPLTVILIDEGLNGLWVHVVNESPIEQKVRLTLTCLRDGATPVIQGSKDACLALRSVTAFPATELWGGFFDTNFAFRFGEPSHDVTCASLSAETSGELHAEAFHFPLGRKTARHELGLQADLVESDGGWALRLATRRFAQSVHISDDNFRPEDNWFHLAPGVEKRIALTSRSARPSAPFGCIAALNGERITYGKPQ